MRQIKLYFSIIILVFSCNLAQSQYSQIGFGLNKNNIYWLNWQQVSSDQIGLTDNPCSATTTSANGTLTAGIYRWNVVPNKIRVVGIISNLSGTLSSNSLQSTRSQGFKNLYSGLSSIGLGAMSQGSVSFNFKYTIQLNKGSVDNPTWTDYKDTIGTVISDAESTGSGEYINASIDNTGSGWEIWDYDHGNQYNTSDYAFTNTINGTTKTAKITSNANKEESVVLFARRSNELKNIQIYSSGNQLISLGIVLPLDFGDAQSSYTSSPNVLPIITDTSNNTNILNGGTYLISTNNPTLAKKASTITWMGNTKPDADSGYIASLNALGDNITDKNDEDGVLINLIPSKSTVGKITIPIVVNNQSANIAYLYAYLDVNKNGTFDPTEVQKITVPSNVLQDTILVSFKRGNLKAEIVLELDLELQQTQLVQLILPLLHLKMVKLKTI